MFLHRIAVTFKFRGEEVVQSILLKYFFSCILSISKCQQHVRKISQLSCLLVCLLVCLCLGGTVFPWSPPPPAVLFTCLFVCV